MAGKKITTDQTLDALSDALEDLTESQFRFVQVLLEGRSATEAYMHAYDCSSMSKRSIWTEASRLKHSPKIALWLKAARKAHLQTGLVSQDNHLRELDRLKEIALENGNMGAAIQAEHYRGKVAGLYVDQVRDVTADPIAALDSIAEISQEVARKLADEEGIDWTPPGEQETKH